MEPDGLPGRAQGLGASFFAPPVHAPPGLAPGLELGLAPGLVPDLAPGRAPCRASGGAPPGLGLVGARVSPPGAALSGAVPLVFLRSPPGEEKVRFGGNDGLVPVAGRAVRSPRALWSLPVERAPRAGDSAACCQAGRVEGRPVDAGLGADAARGSGWLSGLIAGPPPGGTACFGRRKIGAAAGIAAASDGCGRIACIFLGIGRGVGRLSISVPLASTRIVLGVVVTAGAGSSANSGKPFSRK